MFKLFAILLSLSLPAMAQPLSVVTDIGPISGIVNAVGHDQVSVTQLIDDQQSAHHITLRPSQARALGSADLIVLTGPALLQGLYEKIPTLAPETPIIVLQSIEGTVLFGTDEHHHDDHDHADADAVDPHMWLLPENAITLAREIASNLAKLDAANAQVFTHNAVDFETHIVALARNAPVFSQSDTIGLSHNAYQYLLHDLGDPRTIVVTDAKATSPSAKDIAEVQTAVSKTPPLCFVIDPNEPSALAHQIAAAAGVDTITLSPLVGNEVGHNNAYLDLLATVLRGFQDCAS
jgi:zinc transport system substrate-binding protein